MSLCSKCCTTADAQDLYLTEQEALYLIQTGCLSLKREEKQELIESVQDWSSFFVYSILRNESYIPKRATIDNGLKDSLTDENTTRFDVWLPNTRYKKSLCIPDFKLFLINAYSNSDSSTDPQSDSFVISFLSKVFSDLHDPQWVICCMKDAFAEYSFISLTIKK